MDYNIGMSVFGDVMSGLGFVGDLLGLGLNTWQQDKVNEINKEIADQNLKFARETNSQNLALTQQQWARDDNEIQRRLNDASKAGVNPLAVLGAAGNSQAFRVEAPHNDYKPQALNFDFNLADRIQALAMGRAQLDDLRASTALKNSQNAIQQLNVLDLSMQLDDLGFRSSDAKLNFFRTAFNFLQDPDNEKRDLKSEIINKITNGAFGSDITIDKADNIVELFDRVVKKGKNYVADPLWDAIKNLFGGN